MNFTPIAYRASALFCFVVDWKIYRRHSLPNFWCRIITSFIVYMLAWMSSSYIRSLKKRRNWDKLTHLYNSLNFSARFLSLVCSDLMTFHFLKEPLSIFWSSITNKVLLFLMIFFCIWGLPKLVIQYTIHLYVTESDVNKVDNSFSKWS